MANQTNLKSVAYEQLNKDADRILQLIKVQIDNLTLPSCPLYEEVLDTQMFGLQKEVDFAVQLANKLCYVLRKNFQNYMKHLQMLNNKWVFLITYV